MNGFVSRQAGRRAFLGNLLAGGLASVTSGCSLDRRAIVTQPAKFRGEVVNTYPHDPQAFTQGLCFANGFLYEGTGHYGESTLRKVELTTGKVLQTRSLGREYFGEGITIVDNEIYQLTWKEQVCFVYDLDTFEPKRNFRYRGEGWGLTWDGEHLILSDGSPTLSFLDNNGQKVVKKLKVKSDGRPVSDINELEYLQGEILANVWYVDRLARINPESGEVTAWVDLAHLPIGRRGENDVLNGIAYDSRDQRLFVTGKNWAKLFEIRIQPVSD